MSSKHKAVNACDSSLPFNATRNRLLRNGKMLKTSKIIYVTLLVVNPLLSNAYVFWFYDAFLREQNASHLQISRLSL